MKKLLVFALVISSAFVFSQIPNYVPLSGLQAYWPFTGNANDLGPNAYTSTVNGAQLNTDRFGNPNQAYTFNGTSDYISTNYIGIQGSAARAVAFWALSSSTTGISAVSWGSNTMGNRFGCMFNYAGIGVTFEGAYTALTYSPPSAANDGMWHHYVYQFSTATTNMVKVYQDGVLLTSLVSSYMPNVGLNTSSQFMVTFGRIYDPQSYLFFDGSIDEIGIWNRELSNCEINELFRSSNMEANITNTLVCQGQSVSVTVTGATSYVWNTGATGSVSIISPQSTSVVSVQSSNSLTACSNTFTFLVQVSKCTGVQNNEATSMLLTPNPFQNQLSLQLYSAIESVALYDALGKCVLKLNGSGNHLNIATEELKEGVYVVKVVSEEGDLHIQKMILRR